MLHQRALTAIGLGKYRVFSMICYIGMGWAVLPFAPRALEAMGTTGFGLLLPGGIAYTWGSVLYGTGAKKKWLHSVFHIFVKSGFFAFLPHHLQICNRLLLLIRIAYDAETVR